LLRYGTTGSAKADWCLLSLVNDRFGCPSLQASHQPVASNKRRCLMIKKVAGGYKVLSENGKKNLGGPYKTKKEAEKRLKQVEFFKHRKD